MPISQPSLPPVRPRARGTERSLARRAELIAIGRRLFADTSYDALSMDDIARQARVAKGLIYYYFQSKRGYYLAIIQDAVDELVTSAAGGSERPPVERVHRTIDRYLRYAEQNQAAYRTIVTGGVGFDAEVHAIRDGVREAIIATIAEGRTGAVTSRRSPAWACWPGCAAWRAPPSTGSAARSCPARACAICW